MKKIIAMAALATLGFAEPEFPVPDGCTVYHDQIMMGKRWGSVLNSKKFSVNVVLPETETGRVTIIRPNVGRSESDEFKNGLRDHLKTVIEKARAMHYAGADVYIGTYNFKKPREPQYSYNFIISPEELADRFMSTYPTLPPKISE